MATKQIEAMGLRCPQPVLRIAAEVAKMQAGDILEAKADCPTFEKDAEKWAERCNKTMVVVSREASVVTIQIHL